jgi:hypothetical protein
MPSVVDKASQFSLQHKRYAFANRYLSGKKRFIKFYHQFNFSLLIQHRRLVYQRSDMPQQDSEEQVFVTRNKRSSASPEPTQAQHSQQVPHALTLNSWACTDCFQNPSSGGSNKPRTSNDQESGQGRRGSPGAQ